MMKYIKEFLIVSSCSIFLGCNEVERSSVNRYLVDEKVQGGDLAHQLKYYKLENKRFPEDLRSLDESLKSRNRFTSGAYEDWSYAAVSEGKGCFLIRNSIIEGYFIFLDNSGNIIARDKLPHGEELIYEGP